MEALERRGLLKMMLGLGAAAVCGLKASESIAKGAAPAGASAAEAVTETVEAALEPNQFIVIGGRRRRRRRGLFLVRPRRRRRVFVIRRRRRRW